MSQSEESSKTLRQAVLASEQELVISLLLCCGHNGPQGGLGQARCGGIPAHRERFEEPENSLLRACIPKRASAVLGKSGLAKQLLVNFTGRGE